jgi:hypothetical protein
MPSKLDEDERNNLSDRASSSSEVADADSGEEDESSGHDDGDYRGRVQGSDEEEEHDDSNHYTMDVNESDEEEFGSVTVDVAHGRTFEEMFDRRKIADIVDEDSEEEVDSVADKKDEPDSDCEIVSLELNTTAKAVSKDWDGESELEESEEERDLADAESGESEVPTYDDNDLQKADPEETQCSSSDSAVRRSSRLAEKDPSGPLDRVMDIIEGSTVLGKQPSGKQTGKTGTCDS